MTKVINACHVMAKPSGSICNLDCKYCFYLEKEKLYPERNQNWRMNDATLELFIKQHIEAQAGPNVEFAWQGGEPTLLGIEFYEKVVALCGKYNTGKQINHAFQTNAILINDAWCQFFKQHHFLVGVSIDGPKDLHDHYRVTRSGKGTHNQVMKGIEHFKAHQIPFNTLTVVNANNSKHPKRVYEFLKRIGSEYLQFIPLVERESNQVKKGDALILVGPEENNAKVTPWSVPADAYGHFLNTVFDLWVKQDVGKVFVQTFDTTLASWLGEPAGVCIFSETCGHAFALEANGDLYNCDHYVYPEHKLGNIYEMTIKTMNNSDQAIIFGTAKKSALNADCQRCEYRFACHGGCPKHRFNLSPTGKPQHNYFCQGYKSFFAHSEKNMKVMATLLKHRRPASEIIAYLQQQKLQVQSQASQGQLSRNALCPCESGKKYKRCCGA
ncbi:MAG: hypothetical protein ACJAZP_001060 [Psychromonas sp.]|jgi:uncharacterized protein|uniref:anaerobic sulfatase maturase n=1 Tax=Psychromonas sp. TaxID=1884585 RepID=UPI0039E5EABC